MALVPALWSVLSRWMSFPQACGRYISRHAFAFAFTFTCLLGAAYCFSMISMMFNSIANFSFYAGALLTCANALSQNSSYMNYTSVTGYFLQDDPITNATVFDFTATNFGLINRTYATDSKHVQSNTQWQRFATQISTLQHNASRGVRYKLLFMGRHGEGFHNAAESYYGTPAWNCYYSILNGNATTTWADAHLTTAGVSQAQRVNRFWAAEIEGQRITTPQSFYTSPLTRCLATAQLSFDGLTLQPPFIPTVKELLREGISGHTCDRRSNKSYIQDNFPSYRIEQGFTEEDLLWEPLHGETATDQDVRSKTVLDDIFEHDSNTYISITSHSGEIASILRVLGHRPFSLSTGAVIPVLVKAEVIQKAEPVTAFQPFTGICTCTTPPPPSATSSECTTATAFVAPAGGGPN